MTITSFVQYDGNLRTEATHQASGEKIITDAPVDNNGKGQAFSPTDLVATALASCMLTVMGIHARNHGFELGKTEVEVVKVMGVDPRRIVEIDVKIKFRYSNYTEKERKILEVTATTCPVAKSLHPDLIQNISFEYDRA